MQHIRACCGDDALPIYKFTSYLLARIVM